MTTQATTDGFFDANKTHFDAIAHQYDDNPQALERARRFVFATSDLYPSRLNEGPRTAARMREAYDFNEDTTTVMEYACGTGLVSRELAPYAKRIVGVDISQGMVDQFNMRVSNQGIAPEEMQAVCLELKGELGELADEKFDVIVCASAYHHFTSIDDVTRILAYFLKPGGALLVVDLAKHIGEHGYGHGHAHAHGGEHGHGHGHAHAHGGDHEHGHQHHDHAHHPSIPPEFHHLVPHRGGLDEADMRKAFEGAGLESFSFEDGLVAKNDAKLFLAKGIRPAA